MGQLQHRDGTPLRSFFEGAKRLELRALFINITTGGSIRRLGPCSWLAGLPKIPGEQKDLSQLEHSPTIDHRVQIQRVLSNPALSLPPTHPHDMLYPPNTKKKKKPTNVTVVMERFERSKGNASDVITQFKLFCNVS